MRLRKNDIVRVRVFNRDGSLLATVTDSGFSSIAAALYMANNYVPQSARKPITYEVHNITKEEIGTYNNCGKKILF